MAPHLVNPLVDAIARDDVDAMMALLASTFRPPTLRNTSGEDPSTTRPANTTAPADAFGVRSDSTGTGPARCVPRDVRIIPM